MNNLKSQLAKFNKNLNILREREAKYGGNAPVDLLNQIDDHVKAIELVHKALNGQLTLTDLKTQLSTLNVDLWRFPFVAPSCPDFYQHYRLPPNYIPRLELLAEVKQKLLSSSGVLALHGMGGIGKSVLARALCDDPDIRAAFADGILWTELGEKNITETELKARLSEWINALGGIVNQMAPTLNELKNILAELLNERACLLIVDNVWKRTDAENFCVDGPACRLLLTTRNAVIAQELGADVYPLPGMAQAEAVQLLEEWAGGQLATTDITTKIKIVERLGCLPLAIKLAGSQLRRQQPETWLAGFNAQKLKSQSRETIHDNLYDTLALSLDVLKKDKDTRYLYTTLAIFKGAEAVPVAPIARLWSALGDLTPEEVNERLHDLAVQALLQLDLSAKDAKTVSLHDLLRDFINDELGADGQLQAHQALLATYGQTQTGEGWPTAPDDGYLYDHLAYHLHNAGQDEELHALFENDAWLKARSQRRGYTYDGFLADLETAWQAARAWEEADCAAGRPMAMLVRQVRYGLLSSSIASLSGNVPPELLARAVEIGYWAPTRGLALATRMPETGQRAKAYIALLKTGQLDEKQQNEARERGLEAALAMDTKFFYYSESSLAEVLGELAPHLQGEQLSRVFKAALEIQDINALSEVWEALAVHLRGKQLAQVLDIVLNMPNRRQLFTILEALAPYLENDYLLQALDKVGKPTDEDREDEYYQTKDALEHRIAQLEAAQKENSDIEDEQNTATKRDTQLVLLRKALINKDDSERLWTLKSLFRRATEHTFTSDKKLEKQLLTALDTALRAEGIEDDYSFRSILRLKKDVLAGILDGFLETAIDMAIEEELSKVLTRTRYLGEEHEGYYQAHQLARMAPRLKGKLLDRALDKALQHPRVYAEALEALASQMDPVQLERTLESVLSFGSIAALKAIVPRLEGQLLKYALEAVLALDLWNQKRTEGLIALAPQLIPELLRQALEVVTAIDYDNSFERKELERVLLAFAPWLRDEPLDQALPAALKLPEAERGKAGNGISRKAVLAALAPNMNITQLKMSLEALQEIHDEVNRIETLTTLITGLNGKEREVLLAQAMNLIRTASPGVRDYLLFKSLPLDTTGQFVQLLDLALAEEEDWQYLSWWLLGILEEGFSLPDTMNWKQVLEICFVECNKEENERDKAGTLATLIPWLDDIQLQQVQQTASEMEDVSGKALILAALAQRFQDTNRLKRQGCLSLTSVLFQRPQQFHKAALDAIFLSVEQFRKTQEAERYINRDADEVELLTKALIILAPQLKGEQLERAIEAAWVIHTKDDRFEALSALAFQLKDPRRQEILASILGEALASEDEYSRAQELGTIAPYLEGELLKHALAVATALSEKYNAFINPRAIALSKLAPYLEGELRTQVLKAALSLKLYGWRAMVLNALADGHPDWVQAEASALRPAILQILRQYAEVERSAFLNRLAELQPVWLSLAPARAAWDIAQTIIEVCDEWEWQ